MPQQESREENSVLFSLQELQKMEEQRVEQEKAGLRAQQEAERKAKEDAERRLRDAEEAKVRAVEDARRREEEIRLAGEREERIRIEEGERRARIEAETRLREEQMRLEAQSSQHRKSNTGMIVGVVAAFMIAGGTGFYFYNAHVEEKTTALRREQEKKIEAAEAKAKEQEAKYAAMIAEKQKEIEMSKDEVQRERLRQEQSRLQEQKNQVTSTRRRTDPKDDRPATRTPTFNGKKKDISDNPLDGL